MSALRRAPRCLARRCPPHPSRRRRSSREPQPRGAASTPRQPPRREWRPWGGRAGAPGGGGGPSRARACPSNFLQTFCGDAGLGRVGPPPAVLQLNTGRVGGGVCPRAWTPPAPHAPPATPRCHELLGDGPDRHSRKLERSPAGGWGQEASRGTISPLSSISEYIIYEPPHLGAPFAPRASKQVCNLEGRFECERTRHSPGPLSSANLGGGTPCKG